MRYNSMRAASERGRWFAMVFALLACPAICAAPVEGKDYFTIKPAQPTSNPAKIVVSEYFSYQCPHCYSFAQPFASWSKALPADVQVERVAVAIGHATWAPSARAYYALEAMNANQAIDDSLFAAIHKEGAKLETESSIAAWLGKHGVNSSEFTKLYKSFGVQLKTRRADDLSRSHRIPSVPALVIDGEYMIAIADDGEFGDQLKVADFLVEKVRRER